MRRLNVLALVAVLAASVAITLEANDGVRFTAHAISLGGPNTRSGTAQVDIVIDRWSTDAERQRLRAALKGNNQDELLETLQDLKPVGHIRTPQSVGYDLHYAHQVPGEDGGQRIIIATDRSIGFWEAANRPRTIDYPFTFIELRVDRNGEGEGKLSLATKVTSTSDGRVVELENYAAQPVMLTNVKREKS